MFGLGGLYVDVTIANHWFSYAFDGEMKIMYDPSSIRVKIVPNFRWALEFFLKEKVYIDIHYTPLNSSDQRSHELIHTTINVAEFYQIFQKLNELKNVLSVGASHSFTIEECSVCLDKSIDTVLPCMHGFCTQCLLEWRETGNTCPLCRTELDANDPNESWNLEKWDEKDLKNRRGAIVDSITQIFQNPNTFYATNATEFVVYQGLQNQPNIYEPNQNN